jgi:hypothetical protein
MTITEDDLRSINGLVAQHAGWGRSGRVGDALSAAGVPLTAEDLTRANGLVALHGRVRTKLGGRQEALFQIERELLMLGGIKLDHPIGPPDPHAPPGGSAVALRKAA